MTEPVEKTNNTENNVGEVKIRLAKREDMPLIHKMILELATYEGVPDGPQLTVDELIADGFDSSPPWYFALVAECAGEMVGYALCNRAYSSWTRQAFYIEDLFVHPSQRRRGIGLHLLRFLCQMAISEGVNRIDWHVLESNATALGFYKRIGAVDLRVSEGRAALRLPRECIEALVAPTANNSSRVPT